MIESHVGKEKKFGITAQTIALKRLISTEGVLLAALTYLRQPGTSVEVVRRTWIASEWIAEIFIDSLRKCANPKRASISSTIFHDF